MSQYTNNPYRTLGFKYSAKYTEIDLRDISKKVKALKLSSHPDKGGDAQKFKEITAAAEVILDRSIRNCFNETLFSITANERLDQIVDEDVLRLAWNAVSEMKLLRGHVPLESSPLQEEHEDHIEEDDDIIILHDDYEDFNATYDRRPSSYYENNDNEEFSDMYDRRPFPYNENDEDEFSSVVSSTSTFHVEVDEINKLKQENRDLKLNIEGNRAQINTLEKSMEEFRNQLLCVREELTTVKKLAEKLSKKLDKKKGRKSTELSGNKKGQREQRTFCCKICQKEGFSCRQSLWRHVKSHSPKSRKCKQCDFVCHRKDVMDIHMGKFHQ